MRTSVKVSYDTKSQSFMLVHKSTEICFHPSHPCTEWEEILLWNYEIYQGTIGDVLIYKMFCEFCDSVVII